MVEMMNKLPTAMSANGQQEGKEAQGNKNKIGGLVLKRGLFMHLSRPFSCFTPKVLPCTILLGLRLGFDNFTYAWGISYIPVSIATLLLSSQLAFTTIFACLIVKQPMNFSTLNCIILLTLSSALVGITSSHETPAGVTTFQYAMGVMSTMITAVLFGLYLPLLELLNDHFRKKQVAVSFSLVLETQIVIQATASTFSCLGMAVCGDFKKIMAEAEGFGLRQLKYWLCLVLGAISWQMNFEGSAGSFS
ncbi:probable purine permease 4 isoform X2 [Nymphaea colorata]|uniref:probable purine permease 4 isoform X2 n=1 Tax=Nymphaea colorata TaxID=210225 RepID=UPI00129E9319|nr:probable purine permease 4 isoform X2 [Nymphaea colorata]